MIWLLIPILYVLGLVVVGRCMRARYLEEEAEWLLDRPHRDFQLDSDADLVAIMGTIFWPFTALFWVVARVYGVLEWVLNWRLKEGPNQKKLKQQRREKDIAKKERELLL